MGKRILQITLVAAFVLLVMANIWLFLSSGESLYNELRPMEIDTTLYKGHTMLIYVQGTTKSMCHSPECKKCTQIYD